MLPVSCGATKAGANQTEPAYQLTVVRRHAWKLVLLVLLSLLVFVLHDYNNHHTIDSLRLGVHSIVQSMDTANAFKQSLLAKTQQELERNLDRDIKDAVVATEARRSLLALRSEFVANVTSLVSAEMTRAKADGTASSIEAVAALDVVAGRVQEALTASAAHFLIRVDGELTQLNQRLLADAEKAKRRRDGLQGEIVQGLHHGKHEKDALLSSAFDDDAVLARDGVEEEGMAGDDYEWQLQTERWHNATVHAFFHHLDTYLTDVNATVPLAKALDEGSELHKELSAAMEHLRDEKASWHDVQDLLHNREEELAQAGMPKYQDVEEQSADDEFAHYSNFQHWHVHAYLEDCLWPTRLKNAMPDIKKLRHQFETREISTVDLIGELEEMTANEVVPHYWLHHSADDMFYGRGGMDDYAY